jgi:hypothetical protein
VVEGTIYHCTRLKNDGLLSYLGRINIRTTEKYYGLTRKTDILNELTSTWTELSDAVNLITNQIIAMNKTVNINLGGMFFHIDEDAYLKLTRYFDAIKRSLSTSSGQDEIIKDIEMRVSVCENQKTDKHVVGLKTLTK